MTEQLTAEALPQLELKHGAHKNPAEGVCLLEAVAWFAGEDHTDHPQCVSRFLGEYGRRLNDNLADADRQKLKPFIPRLVGTAGDGLDDQRRYLAIDWAVRTAVPRYLDIAELTDAAAELRNLPPVVDEATRRAARKALDRIYDMTWDARQARRQKLREIFAAEYAKRKPKTVEDYVAVAAAVAAAAAAAVAAADAAADADAVAVAAAAADADAAADAAAAAEPSWGEVYWAVRRALREKWTEDGTAGALGDAIRTNTQEGIDLLGRLIDPTAA